MSDFADPDTLYALGGVLPGTTVAADPFSAFPIAGQSGIASGTGTSQHGIEPHPSGDGGTVVNAISQVWDWLNQPFTRPLSPMTIFTITGSILVAIILWNMILYHIRIAAESI